MASPIFEALLEEKIEIFKNSFKNVSKNVFWDENKMKLTHPGEFGLYREIVCKEFIRYLIPRRLDIDTGFIFNANNKVSTQCDIIVYDPNSIPLIEDSEKKKFYPVESVAAIGEVKSTMSKSKFIETINKLAKIKEIREYIKSPHFVRREFVGNYDPVNCSLDNIFTFIICEKFDFDISDLCNLITSSYDKEIGHHNKHNLILSLNDGLCGYYFYDSTLKTNRFFPVPFDLNVQHKNSFIPSDGSNKHLKHFSHEMFMAISSISILHTETSNYMNLLNSKPMILEK